MYLSISVLWFFCFWGYASHWGIWRRYLLCEGEASVAGPPFSLQEPAVCLPGLGGLVVNNVLWWRLFLPCGLCFWFPGPKTSVLGDWHGVVELIGGRDVFLTVLSGLFMWSWSVGPGVVFYFLVTCPFQGRFQYAKLVSCCDFWEAWYL